MVQVVTSHFVPRATSRCGAAERGADLTAPRKVRTFLDYWEDRRGAALLPLPKDLDPVEIPKLLSHLCLWDVLDAGLDFRCRLAGEHVVVNYGANPKGLTLSALADSNPSVAPYMLHFRTSLAAAQPLVLFDRFEGSIGTDKQLFIAITPWSEDGRRADYLFNCLLFFPSEAEPLPQPDPANDRAPDG